MHKIWQKVWTKQTQKMGIHDKSAQMLCQLCRLNWCSNQTSMDFYWFSTSSPLTNWISTYPPLTFDWFLQTFTDPLLAFSWLFWISKHGAEIRKDQFANTSNTCKHSSSRAHAANPNTFLIYIQNKPLFILYCLQYKTLSIQSVPTPITQHCLYLYLCLPWAIQQQCL